MCPPDAALGPPCTPLATIFSDRGLTTAIVQNDMFKTDSTGKYSFYAVPGRYLIQVLLEPFTELVRFPDAVLAHDPPTVVLVANTFDGPDYQA